MSKQEEKMVNHSKNKTEETKARAIEAINEMVKNNEPVTYYSVVHKTGISKSFLYNNEEVSSLINSLREHNKNAKLSPEQEEIKALKKENKALKTKITKAETADQKIKALQQEIKDLKAKIKKLEKMIK